MLVIGRTAGRKICARRLHEGAARLGRSHPWKPDGFRPIDLWHDGTSDAAYPEVGAGALAYRNRLRELEKYAHMPQ